MPHFRTADGSSARLDMQVGNVPVLRTYSFVFDRVLFCDRVSETQEALMSDETPLMFEPEELAARQLTRRGLLAAAGAGGLAAVYGLTGARARGAVPSAWLSELAGTVSVGSNPSDPVPKPAYAAVYKAFTRK